MTKVVKVELIHLLGYLASTLAHLTALASEAAHTLLAPLLPHTSLDFQGHDKLVFLVNTIALEGTSLENTAFERQADLIGRDKLLVFDHGLEGLDRSGRIDLVRGGSNKNLHLEKITGNSNLKKRQKEERKLETDLVARAEQTMRFSIYYLM
jgi:hypothetical protein